MVERTKYLTEANLFGPAANIWAYNTGILNNNGGLLLLRSNQNLSDLSDVVTARINLGLRIGADVQPYSERLTAYAGGAAPSPFSLSAMSKINASEWRDFIGAGTVSSVTVSGGTTGLLFLNGTTTNIGVSTLSGVLSVAHGGTGVTSLGALKTNLGLANVDNTSDVNKPISNATLTALSGKFNIPSGTIEQYVRGDGSLATFPVNQGGGGTVTSVTVSGGNTGLIFNNGTITSSGTASLNGTLSLGHGGTGVTSLSALKTLLSINNVDNTSDLNKPISAAVSTALDRRVRIPASLPAGSTLELPTPEAGKVIGWNTAGNALINILPGTGTGDTTAVSYADVFTGNGTQTNFVLSFTPGRIQDVSASVGGVDQVPGVAYTLINNNIIAFTSAIPNGMPVIVRFNKAIVIDDIDANDITTTNFTGSTIPPLSTVQQALQALETAVESSTPGTGTGVARSHVDIFTSDGITTRFLLDVTPSYLDNLLVEIGGIAQIPGVNYSWDEVTNELVLLGTVTAGEVIVARYLDALVIDPTTFGIARIQKFTSVLNQKDYVLTHDPIGQDDLEISIGGIVQSPDDDFILVLPNIIRFNTAPTPNLTILVRYGSRRTIGNGSNGGVSRVDRFMGDGATNVFTLSHNAGSLNNLLVIVDGVPQTPVDDYTLVGNVYLTFTDVIETAVPIVVHYSDLVEVGGTSASLVTTSRFTGSVIPAGSNVQQALQALETAYVTGSTGGIAVTDVFTGTGINTQFILSDNPLTLDNLVVTVAGFTLTPTKEYNWTSGTLLTFVNPPEQGFDIVVRYGIVNGASTSGIVNTRQNIYTGDGVEDTFTLPYDPSNIDNLDITIGGVRQTPHDEYVLISSNVVLFTDPPPVGEKVIIRYLQGVHESKPVEVNLDVFVADGTQTVFTLSNDPGFLNNLDITIGGVAQTPTEDYSWTSGHDVHFVEAPLAGKRVVVRYLNAVIQIPAEISQAYHDIFTGDGTTVNFTLTESPGSVSNLDVSIEGITQTPTVSYNWVSDKTLTFTQAPPAGKPIVVKYLGAVSIGSLSASMVHTTDFTGNVIPGGSTVQQAIQSLETAVSDREIRTFISRTAAITAIVPSSVNTINVLHQGTVLHYKRDASGTALFTNGGVVAWSPADAFISPYHWGARWDGVADDTLTIQAADAYARSKLSFVTLPQGTGLASQILVYTNSSFIGHGRDATTVKQIAGSNMDFFYGVNSNACWDVADPTGFAVGYTLKNFTIDGNYPINTSGSVIAIYGPRPIIDNIYIKNAPEHGIRTEYIDDVDGGVVEPFAMEGQFSNIRIDTTGKHGWWFNGPHDSVSSNFIVIDAGQSQANTYNGFHFGTRSNGRHVSLHAWTRGWKVRARAALEIVSGTSGHDFSGGCHFEGGYVANVILSGQLCRFDSTTHYYAAWNGWNVILVGNACTQNSIEGVLTNPGPDRPACSGIKLGHYVGDFVAHNRINVQCTSQEVANFIFDTNNTGGNNEIRGKCYNTTNATIFGTPHPTDDVDVVISNTDGRKHIRNRQQSKSITIAPGQAATWGFDYPFEVVPHIPGFIIAPTGPVASDVWVTNRATNYADFYNGTSVTITITPTAIAAN